MVCKPHTTSRLPSIHSLLFQSEKQMVLNIRVIRMLEQQATGAIQWNKMRILELGSATGCLAIFMRKQGKLYNAVAYLLSHATEPFVGLMRQGGTCSLLILATMRSRLTSHTTSNSTDWIRRPISRCDITKRQLGSIALLYRICGGRIAEMDRSCFDFRRSAHLGPGLRSTGCVLLQTR